MKLGKYLRTFGCHFIGIACSFGAFFLINAMAIPLEAVIIRKEIGNGWYSVLPYYYSKILVDIPVIIVSPLLATVSLLVLTGLPYTPIRYFGILWY